MTTRQRYAYLAAIFASIYVAYLVHLALAWATQ